MTEIVRPEIYERLPISSLNYKYMLSATRKYKVIHELSGILHTGSLRVV